MLLNCSFSFRIANLNFGEFFSFFFFSFLTINHFVASEPRPHIIRESLEEAESTVAAVLYGHNREVFVLSPLIACLYVILCR